MERRVLDDRDIDNRDMAADPHSGEPIGTADLFRNPPHGGPESRYDALFAPDDADSFRTRWQEIQGGFVDEPRRAVEQADQLVASAIKRLADIFAGERQNLERSWTAGGDVSTEDLRQALRRYRSFFDRLLSV